MSEIKYAICCASYSIGNATENFGILWIGDDHWVTEFEDADLFDESTAENVLLNIKAVEKDGMDTRSISIIKVLCSDDSD